MTIPTEHTCKPILHRSANRVADGQKYHCVCGRVWEYVQEDGSLGSYWVPFVKLPKDDTERAKKRKKLRVEAERVWAT